MNQISLGVLKAVADVGRPNQRTLAKQRTREKIVAAATALFSERGYEGATIRDIAKAAGMSTGAVFASFADKSDLFGEIVAADQQALETAMITAADERGEGSSVVAMLDAAAERHMADLDLLRGLTEVEDHTMLLVKSANEVAHFRTQDALERARIGRNDVNLEAAGT